MIRKSMAEKLALSSWLATGSRWQLQMAAADAHQTGYPAATNAILEIAEAAEEALVASRGRAHIRTGDTLGPREPDHAQANSVFPSTCGLGIAL